MSAARTLVIVGDGVLEFFTYLISGVLHGNTVFAPVAECTLERLCVALAPVSVMVSIRMWHVELLLHP